MRLTEAYEQIMGALTLWREARGESTDAKLAVFWVIINRKHDPRWPNTISEVCTQPKQFSCYNAGDPNAVKYPKPSDVAWNTCLEVVESPGLSDPTLGANHYHSYGSNTASYPSWADPAKETAHIGAFRFYKL